MALNISEIIDPHHTAYAKIRFKENKFLRIFGGGHEECPTRLFGVRRRSFWRRRYSAHPAGFFWS